MRLINQPQRVLHRRHHAEAQQINLDEAHVGAVVLVPLHDDAIGHAGVFERDHRRQLALADHHPARVLAEMPRQILHLIPEPREVLDAAIAGIESRRREVARDAVGRIDELELVHHLCQPIDEPRVEAERLADLARRAPAAIGDDVGGHPRALRAVLLIDVLNHTLATIAARQVEIDIRPFAAFFRQEPLEQQIHPDRIDRGDAKAVADGAIGRRSAALHEDVLLAAKIHDVPDDQEVAGEIELLDEIELARDLGAGLVVIRAIAVARADLGDLAEKRRLVLARRHRIGRKPVAEILHGELQPLGERQRFADRLGPIGKEPDHLRRRLQISLGVGGQPASRGIERRVLADGREHVEERPLVGHRKPHAAGRHDRHTEGFGQADERVVVVFLIAAQVTLQLDVDIAAAEQPDQLIEQPTHTIPLGQEQRPPRQGHQPQRHALEIGERQRALRLSVSEVSSA